MLLTVDQTETIVATVKPANASNKRVTWSSSDPAVATVDANGKVTAVKGGTATITVTSVADSSKKATKQVLVGDKLVPAGGIIQEVIDEAEDEDVIAVAPSTYKEQLVINKSLTLLGPNAGIAGTGNRNAEAVITYPDEPKNNSGSSGDYAGLVLVEADDVVISGFTFDDGDKSVNSRLTRGINAHGSNIQITNNIVDGFNYVQILITSSFLDENNNWERYSEYCENAFVEGNYGKNALNFSSIYLQGAAGTVKNNTVENACRAIQIQPYGEQKGGIVENNELNGFRTGIYYNYANKGAGKWLIRDNDITATAVPEGFDQSGEWAGIEVQTFGTSGSGDAPKVSFEGNAVDGSGSNLETVGILMTTPIDDAAEATFTNNTFTGVNVGVDRQAGALMLGDVLENNVFPDGSIVIGDQIKVFVPKEEKVYNKNTGAEFDTIQDAVNAANEDDTILVGPGTFEIDNTLNITVPLTIKGMGPEKTIIDVTKVTDEHNCWGVLVGKSNTVLCDLAIVSTEGRAGYNNLKVSDEFAASVEHLDNIVIENVLIEGGKGIDIHNADATLDNVTVKESKGASIAVSNGSNVTIRDCTTADGAWGSIGVMYKEGYRKSTVTVEDGNEFGEGVLYCERYKAESGNKIVGLGAEWQSYINVERDQLLWVKELPEGVYVENGNGLSYWYASIDNAIEAVGEGDTIKLYDDIETTERLQLTGKNVAFDLNGKSLNTKKLEVNNSTVVFEDSSENGEGTLATDDSYGVINAVDSNVTIQNGRFVSNYNKAGSSGYANVIQVRNSELTINGGYFENTNNVGSYNYLIKAPSYSGTEKTTITINSGTFVSNRNYGYIVTGGSDAANVNVVINGGAFTTTGRHSFLTNVKGSVVVNDCTFTATGNNTVFDIPKDSTVTVKGGTFSVNENSYTDPSLAGLIFHRKTNGWTNVNGTLLVDPVNQVKVNQQTYLGFLAEGATESAKDADGFYTITK